MVDKAEHAEFMERIAKVDFNDPGEIDVAVERVRIVKLPPLHEIEIVLGDSGPGGEPPHMPHVRAGDGYWKLHDAEEPTPEVAVGPADVAASAATGGPIVAPTLAVPAEVLQAVALVRKYFAAKLYETKGWKP